MKKWTVLENVKVEKLVFWWQWFARYSDWRVIFITWWVVPESIVNLRVLKSKKDYLETQVLDIIKKSPIEKEHPNNPYWMNGWCKRVNIPYEEQLKIKENQVRESLFHLEKITWNKIDVQNIIPSTLIDGYRNKVEFSFWKYISAKEQREEHFNVWFHKQWEFSKIEDINWFILVTEEINEIFRQIKNYSKNTLLPVYDQKTHEWFFRHIVIRNSFFTDEIMIILSINHKYPWKYDIENVKNFFNELTKKFTKIKSVYLSLNDSLADISIWELVLIFWQEYITEEILWLKFNISPKSFFQTNSYWAEKLYSIVKDLSLNYCHSELDSESIIQCNISKQSIKDPEINSGWQSNLSTTHYPLWTVLDLYAWTGTIGMILSSYAKKVYSVELVKQASQDWQENAEKNWIKNMEFINAKVEDFLKDYTKSSESADLLIIDPPRAWMHPDALPNILKFEAKTIIYVSCNPSTLARDLQFIIKNSYYKITTVIPVDMFPHTHHIETVVKLEL